MSSIFDCGDEAQLLAGMRHARQAISRGELIVIPTDTVYGVAADAFSPIAVQKLLDAKGRGRDQPPPVLIGGVETLVAIAESVPEPVQRLVDAFWPGGLTIVLPAQPSLVWDLGETKGTVAVRMPDDRIALEMLAETGPLAVSSANLTGRPTAVTAAQAQGMLEDSVAVYLDGGPADEGVASTIIDATSLYARDADADADAGTGAVRILRQGAVTREQLEEVLGDLLEAETETETEAEPETEAETDTEPEPEPAPQGGDT
ncbi:L-threonylcarbamoyladenylate synthase [Microbacterium sp.]|uniref:L-threonylcarbamoyladenylate synthase n=1 Tax=Microbacterium sp. TaxID=51671 RepID=UPI0039E4FBA9